MNTQLTEDNYEVSAFQFQDRLATVSLGFDHDNNSYFYNASCYDTKTLKELYSCEFEFLTEALELINNEFGSWKFTSLENNAKGCGSCIAK